MTVARRALHSVTLYHPEKAYNGFTLFTPMSATPGNTWLIDMQGRLVHRWKLPGAVRAHAELLPNGNLLYGLHDPEGEAAELPLVSGEMVEMDWDGNIVWSHKDPYMDVHDRARMKNGNTLFIKHMALPEEIAAKVKGGVPGTELDGVIWGTCLQEITPEGKVVWEWLAYEHLDPELDAITPGCFRFAWPGFNSVVSLPDGNIMTCSYNTSYIHIIDKATGDVKWRWGQGEISYPHDPSMLDNGNILLFDNGRFHVHFFSPDCSRVIEVNPSTNEIEWEYEEENPFDFCSTTISGCQRLPNGNTLICEGKMGRLFEVTPSGEMVWEYVVPFYARGRQGFPTNMTFRCERYGPDYPGLRGKRLDPEKLHLWNRLYGPDAFQAAAKPIWRGVGRTFVEEEKAPVTEETTQASYQESKPSVGQAGKGRKVSSRLKRLGY